MTEESAQSTRRESVAQYREDYKNAIRRRDKSHIISQVASLGFGRKYAIKLLNRPSIDPKETKPRIRRKFYNNNVRKLIFKAHEAAGVNSKALVTALGYWVEFVVDRMPNPPETWVVERAMKASASTIDRILREANNDL